MLVKLHRCAGIVLSNKTRFSQNKTHMSSVADFYTYGICANASTVNSKIFVRNSFSLFNPFIFLFYPIGSPISYAVFFQ